MEASTAIDWPCAFGSFSSRWSRALRLPVPLYHIGHSRAEKVTSEAPASPPGSNRMWAGGSMPPAHEVFPPRHATAAGRAPVEGYVGRNGLGGSSGLIVKERTV